MGHSLKEKLGYLEVSWGSFQPVEVTFPRPSCGHSHKENEREPVEIGRKRAISGSFPQRKSEQTSQLRSLPERKCAPEVLFKLGYDLKCQKSFDAPWASFPIALASMLLYTQQDRASARASAGSGGGRKLEAAAAFSGWARSPGSGLQNLAMYNIFGGMNLQVD